jgi:MFS family permease
MLTVREPARSTTQAEAPSPGAVRRHVWDNRRAILATVAGFSLLAASSGVALWNAILFIRIYDWPIGKIGPILGTVSLVGTVLGVFIGGWCADFFRRRGHEDANLRVVLAVLAVLIPTYVLFPNAGNPYVSVALLALAIFGTNMCFGCITPALPLVAPARMRSQVVSLYFFTTNLLSTGVTTGVALITDYIFRDPNAVPYSMTITYLVLLPPAWLLIWFARPAYLAEVRRLKEASA